MIVFDTDVFSAIYRGDSVIVARAIAIQPEDQRLTVVTAEEVVRGHLNSIRQAEAGRSRISIESAYEYFRGALAAIESFELLPYPAEANGLFEAWRSSKIRVGTHDLRIAAICVCFEATLVTRNVRDFSRILGLTFECWT